MTCSPPRGRPSHQVARYPGSAAHEPWLTLSPTRVGGDGRRVLFQPCGDVDRRAARSLVAAALRNQPSGTWLDTDVTAGLLAAYGIPLLVTVGVSSPQEAVATADQPGYPVTPKSRSGEILNPCLHLERWIMQFRRMASSAFPQARGLSPGAWCTAGLA